MSQEREKEQFSLPELEAQMLGALELLHYSYRFCDNIFILAFEKVSSFDDLLLDLRVLAVSHIQPILFFPEHENLKSSIQALNARGARFRYLGNRNPTTDELQELCGKGVIPVCTFEVDSTQEQRDQEILTLAQEIYAEKVFIIGKEAGIYKDGKLLSHPSTSEIESLIEEQSVINFSPLRLKTLHKKRQELGIEIIILDDSTGSLFQEIFTHRGKGTLLADDYKNTIRQATPEDAHQISLLMRPYRHGSLILPTTEDDILSEIDSYLVYTVNHQVVAAARLKNYGETSELAKFSTLPRYQGRGRAQDLAKALIDIARNNAKKAVFALSVEPKMWDFFQRLGFEEVSREKLPEQWQVGYDFSRQSKAFWMNL